MMGRWVGLAVCAVMAATPAAAKDRTGFAAIAAGDFASAERTINAERRIFPQRPELMLNLASVYRRTDRIDQARALYRQVLSQAEVMMALPDGREISSHALAQAGLGRLDAGRIAAR